MDDLDKLLAEASEHVMEAEARIIRQSRLIEAMESAGFETQIARSLTHVLQRGLTDLRAHHQEVARQLAARNRMASAMFASGP